MIPLLLSAILSTVSAATSKRDRYADFTAKLIATIMRAPDPQLLVGAATNLSTDRKRSRICVHLWRPISSYSDMNIERPYLCEP